MKFYVYMICCSDNSYYIGHTNNLEMRLACHQTGEIPGYTKNRSPVKLVWSEEFSSREEAFYRERQVKGWSRSKKEALTKGDWNKIVQLSNSYLSTMPIQEADHPSTGSG